MKVSVIIPVYNAGAYLMPMMNSVINQTLKDIEIIPVDDGSTDRSIEILKGYAEKDERVKPVFNEHKGEKFAVDTGRELAQGEYIIMCDHDDYMPSFALEQLYKASEGKADIVKGTAMYVYPDGKRQSNAFKSTEPLDWRTMNYDVAQLHFLQPPELWTMLLRREWQKDIELGDYMFNDTDFVFKARVCAKDFRYIPDVVYYWNIHESASHSTKYPFNIVQVYDSLEAWLKENCWEYWEIFTASKFAAYIWNKNRLTDEDRNEFEAIIRRDMQESKINPMILRDPWLIEQYFNYSPPSFC